MSLPKTGELRFMADVQWVQPCFVADQISALRSGEGGGSGDEAAAPGLHGNGLGTVTLGGVDAHGRRHHHRHRSPTTSPSTSRWSTRARTPRPT